MPFHRVLGLNFGFSPEKAVRLVVETAASCVSGGVGIDFLS